MHFVSVIITRRPASDDLQDREHEHHDRDDHQQLRDVDGDGATPGFKGRPVVPPKADDHECDRQDERQQDGNHRMGW
jgi:hypothetical protein